MSKSKDETIRESASQFHNDGLYLPTRSIWSGPEMNKESAAETIKNLHILDKSGDSTITIFIDNEGGCVVSGFGVFDAINDCGNYVRAIVRGEASSMGSILLQAADERLISPNSTVMIHDGTVEYEKTSFETVKAWQKWLESINEFCYNLYLEKIKAKHPKFRKQDLKRYMKNDMIFRGQEAIDFGLADSLTKRGE